MSGASNKGMKLTGHCYHHGRLGSPAAYPRCSADKEEDVKAPFYSLVGTWVTYALAWALPVHADGVRLPEGLPGWQAFRVAASAVWPYEGTSFESFDAWYWAVISTLSAATNFVMLGSLCVVVLRSPVVFRVIAWACAFSFIINAYWCVFDSKAIQDLRIGYLLWWWSFLAAAIAAFRLRAQHQA